MRVGKLIRKDYEVKKFARLMEGGLCLAFPGLTDFSGHVTLIFKIRIKKRVPLSLLHFSISLEILVQHGKTRIFLKRE